MMNSPGVPSKQKNISSLPNILIKLADLFPSSEVALSNGDEMKCNSRYRRPWTKREKIKESVFVKLHNLKVRFVKWISKYTGTEVISIGMTVSSVSFVFIRSPQGTRRCTVTNCPISTYLECCLFTFRQVMASYTPTIRIEFSAETRVNYFCLPPMSLKDNKNQKLIDIITRCLLQLISIYHIR